MTHDKVQTLVLATIGLKMTRDGMGLSFRECAEQALDLYEEVVDADTRRREKRPTSEPLPECTCGIGDVHCPRHWPSDTDEAERNTLQRYAQHTTDCNLNACGMGGFELQQEGCNCGLDALTAKLEATPEGPWECFAPDTDDDLWWVTRKDADDLTYSPRGLGAPDEATAKKYRDALNRLEAPTDA